MVSPKFLLGFRLIFPIDRRGCRVSEFVNCVPPRIRVTAESGPEFEPLGEIAVRFFVLNDLCFQRITLHF